MIERIETLISEKKYSEFKLEVQELKYADIAEILNDLSDESLIKFFRLLPKNIAAETFAYLEIDSQQIIITSLTAKEAASIIDNMYADDATDLMEEIPANVVQKILSNTTSETRRDINQLLMYKEHSAGSIMTVEFMDIKDVMTVKDAIERIKKEAVSKETIDFCYVLSTDRKLLGTVSLKQLILTDNDVEIKEIMGTEPIAVNTHTDQEEVAKVFQKYDFTTMPVVDSEDRLVGIITIDDIIDIIEEEATEDIEKMAAITPTDKPYMKTGVVETWKKRIPWLLILMISATFTGKIIQSYENALATYVILTTFIPMFMDTGGNAGGQASVTIIRGLSLNEIELGDIFRIMWKEFKIAILCGITLAAINFLKLVYLDRIELMVAAVVCITLVLTVLVAKIIGCSLPIIAKKIGFDPAVMASPLITTIVDALALIIFFQIAVAMLNI
jgi:Mg2+ transporter (mgtE)